MKNWVDADGIRFFLDPYADGIYAYPMRDLTDKPYLIGDAGSYGCVMAFNIAFAYHPLLSKE